MDVVVDHTIKISLSRSVTGICSLKWGTKVNNSVSMTEKELKEVKALTEEKRENPKPTEEH